MKYFKARWSTFFEQYEKSLHAWSVCSQHIPELNWPDAPYLFDNLDQQWFLPFMIHNLHSLAEDIVD